MKIENLRDLELIRACLIRGSLTGAADALGLTPSAASAALKRVERLVGVRLFERTTRAMRPTPAGDLLGAYAQRTLELLAEAESELTQGQHELAGTIRLTAPSGLARHVLLPLLDEFMAQHPHVRLRLTASDTLQDLAREPVDLALRYGALEDSGFVAFPLAAGHEIACAAPAYVASRGAPEHPDDLRQHDCLVFDIRGKRHVDWLFSHAGDTVKVRVDGRRGGDAHLCFLWALAGQGILYESETDLRAALASGHLVRVLPAWLGAPMPLQALIPSRGPAPARVTALIRHLQTGLR